MNLLNVLIVLKVFKFPFLSLFAYLSALLNIAWKFQIRNKPENKIRDRHFVQ